MAQATKKTDKPSKKWKRVERKGRYRFWRPEVDGSAIVGVLGARTERDGKYGTRGQYLITVTEPGDDAKGLYDVGDTLAIGETAVLATTLPELVGKEVMISPAGLDGRVRLFEIDVADD